MDEAFATAVVLLIIVMIINMAAEYIAGKIKK
jgi:ABC-type phosphate transport system permease subunit